MLYENRNLILLYALKITEFIFERPVEFYYKPCLFRLVDKIMMEQNFCQLCGQKDSCRQAYERLGSSQGPSVVSEVIFAFLLPMLVFIVVLAAFEKILARTPLTAVVGFIMALIVTAALMLTIKKVLTKNKKN